MNTWEAISQVGFPIVVALMLLRELLSYKKDDVQDIEDKQQKLIKSTQDMGDKIAESNSKLAEKIIQSNQSLANSITKSNQELTEKLTSAMIESSEKSSHSMQELARAIGRVEGARDGQGRNERNAC